MWESKRKLLKTCLFSVLRRKTLKLIQTNQYQQAEKTLPKMYILRVLSLLPTKKREKGYKALYIGKQRDNARKVYNECFIVQKNHKAKNAKNSCIWRSFLDTKMLKLMNNTLN